MSQDFKFSDGTSIFSPDYDAKKLQKEGFDSIPFDSMKLFDYDFEMP